MLLVVWLGFLPATFFLKLSVYSIDVIAGIVTLSLIALCINLINYFLCVFLEFFEAPS